MSAPSLVLHNARVLTLRGDPGPRRGEALRELGIIEAGYVAIEDGRICGVGSGDGPDCDQRIDAGGRVLMPTFIDCHTHACWAGERFDEFEMKLRGATYLDILKAGGGIMSTVRSTRSASVTSLTDELITRLGRMASLGSAAVEVKSGYGLSTEAELKMLHAIEAASSRTPITVVPTFLGAHAKDPDHPNFVDEVINETLPAVAHEFPGITCDAYCEDGAWSLDETRRLFEAAVSLGCTLRVHADQFNSLGMLGLAVEMGATSVDHLEATTDADLRKLAASDTFGVMLPCSGFQVDDRYGDGRSFVDAGGRLAIASNYNPGSAPTPSIPFTIALACRKLGLTPAEAICCVTVNAASLLGLDADLGSIEIGKRACLQLLDMSDERSLAYEFATPGPLLMLIDGVPVPHGL